MAAKMGSGTWLKHTRNKLQPIVIPETNIGLPPFQVMLLVDVFPNFPFGGICSFPGNASLL